LSSPICARVASSLRVWLSPKPPTFHPGETSAKSTRSEAPCEPPNSPFPASRSNIAPLAYEHSHNPRLTPLLRLARPSRNGPADADGLPRRRGPAPIELGARLRGIGDHPARGAGGDPRAASRGSGARASAVPGARGSERVTVLQLGLAIAFGLSLAGFCAWSVWTWSVKSLAPGADWTSRAIFYTGQGIVWV